MFANKPRARPIGAPQTLPVKQLPDAWLSSQKPPLRARRMADVFLNRVHLLALWLMDMSRKYFRGLDNQSKANSCWTRWTTMLCNFLFRQARETPPVTAVHIFMYLVEGVCFYTI